MRPTFSLRRVLVARLPVAVLALGLALLAVVPGGTAPVPCPDEPHATSAAATIPPPSGLDPEEPRTRPRRGIDLSVRILNLRVEFPWMRSLPVSPGHQIVITLFAPEAADGRP